MHSKLAKNGEKLIFVLAVAVLGLLYGYAARTFDLFPNALLERAWLQGEAVAGSETPDYVAPRVYERSGARIADAEAMQPGLTLVTTLWEDSVWNPGAMLIDDRGRSLHQWRIQPQEVFPDSVNRRGLGLAQLDFQGAHLFPNGDLLVNVEYAGTVRLDACGAVKWKLPAGNHHSIERAGDGSFWIPGVTRRPRRGSPANPNGFPGIGRPVYQDLLLRVSPEGEVVESLNVLDLLYENGLVRHFVRSGGGAGRDVTHVNDIQPLPDTLAEEYPLFEAGDLAVSLKYQNLVFVVDPDSRRIKWHLSHPFIRQHDPDWMGEGWIGVFDNNQDGTLRGELLGGSRIVAVEPHTDSVRTIFPTERSEPFYTTVRGKWQRLDNGNLLLTESAAGRIVEVAPDGRTVWEWIARPYGESTVPYVSRGERTDLTAEQVSDWPCGPSEIDAAAGSASVRVDPSGRVPVMQRG